MENQCQVTSGFMQLGASQGWQCPICKRVLAPFMTECPCRGQGPETHWTTTTTTPAEEKPAYTIVPHRDSCTGDCCTTSYTSGSSTTMSMSDYTKSLNETKRKGKHQK